MRWLLRQAGIVAMVAGSAIGAPVLTPVVLDGGNDTASCAGAPLGGLTATGDSFQDRVEVRDVRGVVRRAVDRAQIQALAPFLSLDGGPDGVGAVTLSASGRLLFIAAHDDTTPADGPSDAVIRVDVSTGQATLFARLNIFSRGDVMPRLAMLHYRGLLLVGTEAGQVVVLSATANQTTGTVQATWTLPGAPAGGVRGLSVDRDTGTVFVATSAGVYRTVIPASLSTAPTFTALWTGGSDIRALTFADHFGAPTQRGLYILSGDGSGSRIDALSAAAALGTGGTPSAYLIRPDGLNDLAFTSDGSILIAADEDAFELTDTLDTRPGFDQWMADEFAQSLAFARGLIAPDGEPAGWVIDADVLPAQSRFHPATPDGAAWAVLMLLMSHELSGDPLAQSQVRTILSRHAGLLSGPRPVRSSDGIFKHWLDPATGNTEAGWPDEFATLSTMKIVLAAARAMERFPDDAVIARAASIIIFRTRGYDAYFQFGTDAMAFKGLAGGGPDTGSWSRPFHEGILFVEQAGVYGGATSRSVSGRWFNRSLWPTASWIPGRPITSANPGQFDAAFLSMYPLLLSAPFRADPAWRTQVDNIRWSHAAFTDDNAVRYPAMFSAGTAPPPVGYNADSLVNRPGNVTTFTSLMALAGTGEVIDAAAAYGAFRKGARQTFKSGASILYRRPLEGSSAFVPNSAGLPDVSLGALGLAELISPGSVDRVLARAYPTREMCPVDLNADGVIDAEDVHLWFAVPVDLNADGVPDAADVRCLVNWVRRRESADMGRP
jgi:hypothetical protein